MVLEFLKAMVEMFNPIKWNDADFRILKRNRSTNMRICCNTIKTKNFAGHIKSSNLGSTIIMQVFCLQEPALNGIKCMKMATCVIKNRATLNTSSYINQLIQFFQ